MRFERESSEVYRMLVAELANSQVPTIIMGATLIGVSALAWGATHNPIPLLAGIIATVATMVKLILMAHQRDRLVLSGDDTSVSCWWEARHRATTLAVAMSVSATGSTLFLCSEPRWHVLGTALLFGYTSGIVSRVSVRPRIAISAVCVAALPMIAASASWTDLPHSATSIVLCVFLLGSFQTVRHSHAAAVRQIASRLDMASLARNDPLTGLVNRLGLREAYRALTVREGTLAAWCLDLDGFKGINDRHGHAAGDAVLVEVGCRIRTAASEGTSVARLGGDEFAVLGTVRHDAEAAAIAEAIVAALCLPFSLGESTVTIRVSLGYAVATRGMAGLDQLLEAADQASYRVKRRGGGIARVDTEENWTCPAEMERHLLRMTPFVRTALG